VVITNLYKITSEIENNSFSIVQLLLRFVVDDDSGVAADNYSASSLVSPIAFLLVAIERKLSRPLLVSSKPFLEALSSLQVYFPPIYPPHHL